VGEANRGEYITASSGRKRLLASLFSSANLTSWSALQNIFTWPHNHALTKIFVLSNIRFVSEGVR
jgi:hypothetical protein